MMEWDDMPDARLPGEGSGLPGRKVVRRQGQRAVAFQKHRLDEELVGPVGQPKDPGPIVLMGSGIGDIGDRLSGSHAESTVLQVAETDGSAVRQLDNMIV